MEKQAVTLHLPYGLCRNVSFSIAPGECLLLAGPNGSGKTTLLNVLTKTGEDTLAQNCRRPRHISGRGPLTTSSRASGDAGGNGRDGGAQPRRFWDGVSSPGVLIPTSIPKVKGFTVEEFVRTGCYKESDWAGRLSAKMEKRMAEALDLLGLKELSTRDISTLSDGEFQKACIAVGLTRDCKLLMLDEPTAFLDVDGRAMVLGALKNAAEKAGICVIFTSHDLHVSLQFCHRVLAFTPDGRFLESTTDNRLEVLQHAFPGAIIA